MDPSGNFFAPGNIGPNGEALTVALVLAFSAASYFFPTLIGRKKKTLTAIIVLNLLTGWTVIGWIVALVWATTKD